VLPLLTSPLRKDGALSACQAGLAFTVPLKVPRSSRSPASGPRSAVERNGLARAVPGAHGRCSSRYKQAGLHAIPLAPPAMELLPNRDTLARGRHP